MTVAFSSRISPFTSTVIFFDKSPAATAVVHLGNAAHLTSQVGCHQIDVVCQIFPCAADTLDFRLTAKLAFSASPRGNPRHLRSEGIQLIHHRVDGVLEFENFTPDVDRNLFGEIAERSSCGEFPPRCCEPGR